MTKIPFTLDAWLKDKSQKVETREGRIVHNIWPVEPLIVCGKKADVCALIDGEEDALVFFEGGRYLPTTKDTDSPFDLFLVTPEEEMTPFEKELVEILKCLSGRPSEQTYEDYAKEQASELLALAREELFANDTVLKEYAQVAREQGKAEALKDLPRWNESRGVYSDGWIYEGFLYYKNHSIQLSSLEKLPGFKEDGHE